MTVHLKTGKHHPSRAKSRMENIYGRGTMDDKVSVLAILEAVENFAA
jgi:acetylornithine deacetylase/succinyl-diaminopimelate desuccinylase-like protein